MSDQNDGNNNGGENEVTVESLTADIEAMKAAQAADKIKYDKLYAEERRKGLDLVKLKADIEAGKKKVASDSDDVSVVKKELQDIIDEKDKKLADYEARDRSRSIGDAIRKAATAKNAVNVDQVTKLLIGDMSLNDADAIVIKDASGKELLNGQGRALSVDDYVSTFLDKNKHLIKGSGNSGAGGSGGNGGGGGTHQFTTEQIAEMTPDEWKKHGAAIKKAAEKAAGINRR
jgi:hypothetical protein